MNKQTNEYKPRTFSSIRKVKSPIARAKSIVKQLKNVGSRVPSDHKTPGSHERVSDNVTRVHTPFGHIDVKKKLSDDDWIAHAAVHGPDVLHHAMSDYRKSGKINSSTIEKAKKKAAGEDLKKESYAMTNKTLHSFASLVSEAEKKLHPMALHVKPVKVDGQTKYKVHAVGSELSDGIKHGEHLSDSELDDAHEMGAKIKHVKESVDEAMSHQAKTTMKHIPDASPALKKAAKDIKPGIAGYRDRVAMLKAGNVKEEALVEGEVAHSQFLKYHGEAKKLVDGISKGLDKHLKNVTSNDGYNKGQAHWGHVDDVKSFHRSLQDLHDRILQQGEYAMPAKLTKESINEASSESNDNEGPEPDKNITVQLKKAADMAKHGEKGGCDVTFADGKTHHVAGSVAHKVLSAMEKMKPAQRAEAQKAVHTSHAHLMAAHKMLSK